MILAISASLMWRDWEAVVVKNCGPLLLSSFHMFCICRYSFRRAGILLYALMKRRAFAFLINYCA